MTPSTDWKEVVPDGEAEHLEVLGQQLLEIQRKNARGGAAGRALHAKGMPGVLAELTVLPDLPEHARVGLFAKPASYRAYVRFSNGGSVRQSDAKPDVRGVAIKLLGVPGQKIIPGMEQATTQDFLLIQSPSTPFRDATEFVWFVRAAASQALLLPRAIGRFGLGGAIRLIRRLLKSISQPVPSLATSRYYSALPIQFGRHAVHYALAPQAAAEAGAKQGKSPEHFGEELATRLAKAPVVYDFRVQFFVDEQHTPIEDASREWLEADAPFVTLARLTLLQQEMGSAAGQRVAEYVEKLSFDPWHAGVDFRPLGNMMRARNVAYRLSTQERGAAAEPDGGEHLAVAATGPG